jgi:cytoskeletal protein CcmA (bactofilin family)
MLHSNTNPQPDPSQERRSPIGGSSIAGRESPPVAELETAHIPVLGKTLLFRGELTAEEDVILQGRVEGSIRHARNLIIGNEGSVQGDVHAVHLTVEGLVEGDLHCSEAVIVRSTAQVRGNIFSPRVGIMEGALFNGRIEMDPNASATKAGSSRQTSRQPAAPPRPAGAVTSSAQARSGGLPMPPAHTGPTGSSGATLANGDVDEMLGPQRPSKK